MALPSPELIAAAGATVGTLGHIVQSHQGEEGLRATLSKWVFGKFFHTLGTVLANVSMVALAPLPPTVDSLIGALTLFATYYGAGAGANATINRPADSPQQ